MIEYIKVIEYRESLTILMNVPKGYVSPPPIIKRLKSVSDKNVVMGKIIITG